MDLDKVRNEDQTDIVTAHERFCRIVPVLSFHHRVYKANC
jgi:hypothetical protein